MATKRLFFNAILFAIFIFFQFLFADTLSVKEKQYVQAIRNHFDKNPKSPSAYILSAKEVEYLKGKNNLLESHSNMNEKDKEILINEYKRNFFGGTNTPVAPKE